MCCRCVDELDNPVIIDFGYFCESKISTRVALPNVVDLLERETETDSPSLQKKKNKIVV